MLCWICGDPADSGEHIAKASDLRSVFGHVSQRTPLFAHVGSSRNQPVPGINSDKLKFKTRICATCNNARTQPYDRAWEALSVHLRGKQPALRAGETVRLTGVFRSGVRRPMLHVHLYFIKLFGCLIREHSVPITIDDFSVCLLQGRAHPHVHLSFAALSSRRLREQVAITPIHTAQANGTIVLASWFYIVGRLAVNVVFVVPGHRPHHQVHLWHPGDSTKRLFIDAADA
jgi:hypothetical protein